MSAYSVFNIIILRLFKFSIILITLYLDTLEMAGIAALETAWLSYLSASTSSSQWQGCHVRRLRLPDIYKMQTYPIRA